MQVYAQKGQFMHKAEINVTVMHKLTSLCKIMHKLTGLCIN